MEGMNERQVFDRVVELLTPFVRNTEALKTISLQTRVLEDLLINSARLVDIVLKFEDEFDIEIHDEAADSVRTLGDVVKYILDQKNQKK